MCIDSRKKAFPIYSLQSNKHYYFIYDGSFIGHKYLNSLIQVQKI